MYKKPLLMCLLLVSFLLAGENMSETLGELSNGEGPIQEFKDKIDSGQIPKTGLCIFIVPGEMQVPIHICSEEAHLIFKAILSAKDLPGFNFDHLTTVVSRMKDDNVARFWKPEHMRHDIFAKLFYDPKFPKFTIQHPRCFLERDGYKEDMGGISVTYVPFRYPNMDQASGLLHDPLIGFTPLPTQATPILTRNASKSNMAERIQEQIAASSPTHLAADRFSTSTDSGDIDLAPYKFKRTVSKETEGSQATRVQSSPKPMHQITATGESMWPETVEQGQGSPTSETASNRSDGGSPTSSGRLSRVIKQAAEAAKMMNPRNFCKPFSQPEAPGTEKLQEPTEQPIDPFKDLELMQKTEDSASKDFAQDIIQSVGSTEPSPEPQPFREPGTDPAPCQPDVEIHKADNIDAHTEGAEPSGPQVFKMNSDDSEPCTLGPLSPLRNFGGPRDNSAVESEYSAVHAGNHAPRSDTQGSNGSNYTTE